MPPSEKFLSVKLDAADVLEGYSLPVSLGFCDDVLRYAVEDLPYPVLPSPNILLRESLPDPDVVPPERADDASRVLGYLDGLRDIVVDDLLSVPYGNVSQVPVDAHHALNGYLVDLLRDAE
jgi:hypothetical protein